MCYKRLPEEVSISGFLRCPVDKSHIVSVEEYYSHVQKCREPYLQRNKEETSLERFLTATRNFFRRFRKDGRYNELQNETSQFAQDRKSCPQRPGTPRPQRNTLDDVPNLNPDGTSGACTPLNPTTVQEETRLPNCPDNDSLNSLARIGTTSRIAQTLLSDLEEIHCEEYSGCVTSTSSSSNPTFLPEKTEKLSMEDIILDSSITDDSKTAPSRVSLGTNDKDLENEVSSKQSLPLEAEASAIKQPISDTKLQPILIPTNLETCISSEKENLNSHMDRLPTSPKVTFIEPLGNEQECKKDKEEQANEVLYKNLDVDVAAEVENDLEDKIENRAEGKVEEDDFEDATDSAVENENVAKVQVRDNLEKADCEVENNAEKDVQVENKAKDIRQVENEVEKDDLKAVTDDKVEPEKSNEDLSVYADAEDKNENFAENKDIKENKGEDKNTTN